VIWLLSWAFERARPLVAAAVPRSAGKSPETLAVGWRTSAIWNGDVAAVAVDLPTDLDQLFLQARQVLDRLGRRQRAQERAHEAGATPHWPQTSCTTAADRTLAFIDPLLARPAFVVEGDRSAGKRQLGDDESRG